MGIRKILFSPYFVMSIVLLMYVGKVIAKIGIGTYVHSPVITGDGYHNVADIIEAFFVVAVVFYATLPHGDEYPFGRNNVESLFKFGVGIALCYTAFQLAFRCAVELVACVPFADSWIRARVVLPHHESLLMGPQYFWFVAGVTFVSALLSFLIGRYQIVAGKMAQRGSLVTDGIETLNDGRIEGVTCVGVLSEYFFATPVIEYPLGIFVAFLVFRAGRGLVVEGWNTLLQKSIGKEHEDAICALVGRICGVVRVSQLKTFQVGERVICIMKVETRCKQRTTIDIKYAIVDQVAAYLKENDFLESEFFIRFDRPAANRHRIAYGIVHANDSVFVAPSLARSTHFRICDIEDESVVRWKDEVVSELFSNIVAFLLRKRVRTLYLFGDEPHKHELEKAGIGVDHAASCLPEIVGID